MPWATYEPSCTPQLLTSPSYALGKLRARVVHLDHLRARVVHFGRSQARATSWASYKPELCTSATYKLKLRTSAAHKLELRLGQLRSPSYAPRPLTRPSCAPRPLTSPSYALCKTRAALLDQSSFRVALLGQSSLWVFKPGYSFSRALARSDQLLLGSVPELLLSQIIPEPCSVRSVLEHLLDRFNSRVRNPASPIPELLLGRMNSRAPTRPASSSPDLRSVRSVPEPPLGTSPMSHKPTTRHKTSSSVP
ncbi:hypothetical protein B296_00041702 [Ensete ventricosum]|uniref:Uncharacterized protein n=1 Tax=Ensete ventricosum TaxID=4639 RepID=A0A426XFK4_ENSVE|nr:hypothetical protein B296_00041702 [Ensete ventricosum]